MRYKSLTRVLALDLHPRRFGYVVVEGPDRLLDWGVRSCRRKGKPSDVLIQRRLRPLLELWRPSVVVVQGLTRTTPRASSRDDRPLRRLAVEAKNLRVAVRIGPKRAAGLTKHENARQVAEQFPVLERNLPPKRRAWESDHYRMSVFTAAALALAYARTGFLSREGVCDPES